MRLYSYLNKKIGDLIGRHFHKLLAVFFGTIVAVDEAIVVALTQLVGLVQGLSLHFVCEMQAHPPTCIRFLGEPGFYAVPP